MDTDDAALEPRLATGRPGERSTDPGPAVGQSRRSFLSLGAAGLGALGLAACGGNGADTPAAPATPDGNDGPAGDASGGATDARTTNTSPAPDFAEGSMPSIADLEQSGYLWTGARLLFATVGVRPDGIASRLPPGMALAEPHQATVFVAHYPLTAFGSIYDEAAVLVHIEDENGPAWHCPWMVVNEDTALVLGREMLGFPKKMATIALAEASDDVVGTVERRGTEVLRIEADLTEFTEESGPLWEQRIVNVFGSVVGGMQLIDIPPLPEEIHERFVGTASVEVGTSERDPLGEWLEPGEGSATFAVADFALLTSAGVLDEEILPFDWAFEHTTLRAM
ncbi:MAG: acetoacetate decarboxylase family protein [Acidimicrobiia bacterium]|nr:acetoacetate decarboxylase family protein [Acidimicrobiia bacterium]